ncbi:MAG: glycogen/starch/alpha-glucan phosphorylase, partial [bacterium]|nr:glycogen/starch/alpha-glucan phosphorylase [bacterium]
IFGLNADEIVRLRTAGKYHPDDYIRKNPELQNVLNMLKSGELSQEDKNLFKPLYDSLVFGVDGNPADEYFLLADLAGYTEVHAKISQDFKDKLKWQRKALLNIMNTGYFSSDRAIKEYAEEIWKVKPVPVSL